MCEPWQTYYKMSEVIRTSRDIHEKLAACEASFEVLPDFVTAELAEYGELPPTILCRDVAPKLYMQLGQFQKARVAIYRCVKAGAYVDNGATALNYLQRYETTARIALEFLRDNVGFAQNKIYKYLAATPADKDCLKDFVRSSRLIRKEKCGNTNKLFLAKV